MTSEKLIHAKLDKISEDVEEIKLKMAGLPCPLYNDRIKLLQRIVFGGIGIVLTVFVISLTVIVFTNGDAQSKDIGTIEVIR